MSEAIQFGSVRDSISTNHFRNLECRDTLSGKVHYLELRLAEKDEQIKMLMRRNHLEAKNFKVHLHNEQKKYKALCQKLEKTPMKLHVPTASDYGDEINKVCVTDTDAIRYKMKISIDFSVQGQVE